MKIAISLAALLAASGQQSAPPAASKVSELTPIAQPAGPAAKAFVYDKKNSLLKHHFAWSAEAAAVPQLVERLRAAMDKSKAELLANAREYKALRDKLGYPFTRAYSSFTNYATAGQSPRLLSLSVALSTQPGATPHADFSIGGLLWDRQVAKEIGVADLFAEPASMDRLLTQRWCDALHKVIDEERGDQVGGHNYCPKLSDLGIVPTDKDKNGRFERLTLTVYPYIDPYSYPEGSYGIDLVMTPDLIAALKSDYRDSFEVGQPQ